MLIGPCDMPDSSTELAPTDVRKIAISRRRMRSSMSLDDVVRPSSITR